MGVLGELGKAVLSSLESDAMRKSKDKRFRPEQREAFESMAGMIKDARNGNFHLNYSDDDDE